MPTLKRVLARNSAPVRPGLTLHKNGPHNASSSPRGHWRRFYDALVPWRQAKGERHHELVFHSVLLGTIGVVLCLTLLLLVSFALLQNHYVFMRMVSCLVAFLFLGGVASLAINYGRYAAAGKLLVGFYTVLAIAVVALWG